MLARAAQRVVVAQQRVLRMRASAPFRLASSTVFTPEHEYAAVSGSAATVGITAFAAAALGDVVFVSLPAVGAVFKKGCVFVLRA